MTFISYPGGYHSTTFSTPENNDKYFLMVTGTGNYNTYAAEGTFK